MERAHDIRRRIGIALLAAAAVSVMVVAASARPTAGAPQPCQVAEVEGVSVDLGHVSELTALLSPPPATEQARRLAVDAALAHRHLRGFLAGSSASARLEAYRELLGRVRKTHPEPGAFAEAASVLLESLRREQGATSGACHPPSTPAVEGPTPPLGPAPDAAATRARLSGDGQPRPVLRLEQLWLPAGTDEAAAEAQERLQSARAGDARAWSTLAGDGIRHQQLGLVAPGHLARELATAALALQPGQATAPIRTRTGVHVLRLLARWEPGTLSVADVTEAQP